MSSCATLRQGRAHADKQQTGTLQSYFISTARGIGASQGERMPDPQGYRVFYPGQDICVSPDLEIRILNQVPQAR
jgi:hypothetical protein